MPSWEKVRAIIIAAASGASRAMAIIIARLRSWLASCSWPSLGRRLSKLCSERPWRWRRGHGLKKSRSEINYERMSRKWFDIVKGWRAITATDKHLVILDSARERSHAYRIER